MCRQDLVHTTLCNADSVSLSLDLSKDASLDGLQVLHEPCYDTLRTKQQLGYSVHSGVRLTHGILGFAVCVVSGVL